MKSREQILQEAYRSGFEKGAQESVPLMTPYSDRTLSHLSGKPITRRQVWETAVPTQRANTVINAAERHREDNPSLFEGVFDGRNIDRPVIANPARDADFYRAYRHVGMPRLQARDQASREIGMYRPPWAGWLGRIKPDQILTRRNAPLRILAHETFHTDTPATLPQAHLSAHTALRRGDSRPALDLIAVKQRTSIPSLGDSGTVSNVQSVTDRVYPSGGQNPVEIAPQLGTLRMHLEQQGVDTTNPDALRSALQNLGKYTGDNDEAQRFHDTLQNAPRTQDARDRTIEDVLKVMQGIATRKRQAAPNLTAG